MPLWATSFLQQEGTLIYPFFTPESLPKFHVKEGCLNQPVEDTVSRHNPYSNMPSPLFPPLSALSPPQGLSPHDLRRARKPTRSEGGSEEREGPTRCRPFLLTPLRPRPAAEGARRPQRRWQERREDGAGARPRDGARRLRARPRRAGARRAEETLPFAPGLYPHRLSIRESHSFNFPTARQTAVQSAKLLLLHRAVTNSSCSAVSLPTTKGVSKRRVWEGLLPHCRLGALRAGNVSTNRCRYWQVFLPDPLPSGSYGNLTYKRTLR